MAYYSENPRFYVAVDCIIFGLVEGRLCLLLTKRDFEPQRGQWSLMGGFVRRDESVDESARRVLRRLTGIENVYMQQMHTYGDVDRDPGQRVVSVAYYALLGPEEYDIEELSGHNAEWIPIDNIPDLCLDHPLMVSKALSMVRSRLINEPIGLNLLPELFTLSQLQTLYETILGESVDKRNFRKRILETGWVEKTPLIDKSSSRRGASLYRFKTTSK